jgi:beta-lactam-binding protein with PASTA domain
MRTCQSCGAENPDDRDFCSCGEYLRWEPTGFVQAITPEMVQQATSEAPAQAAPEPPAAPEPQVTQAPPAHPQPGNGGGNGHTASPPPPAPPPPPRSTAPVKAAAPPPAPAPIPNVAKTLVRGAVPPAQPPAAPPEHEPATIVLRLPEGDPAKGETLHQQVEPGLRERVLALVRNQSGIVDNYDLRVEGMPDDWWSIYPGTVYLVPFGSGGTYEQEVEVHLHPPKSPLAEAKVWDLRVVAQSKAQSREAASAPLALHVLPYVETVTTLRPQRKKGRRKADFDVTVTNKANAPVLVALEGEDPDGELQFGFNRPPQEIPAGAAVASQMRVKPPKQIWIGRPQDRRLEVKTITGEEAAERAAADPLAAEVLAQPGGFRRRGLLRRRVPDVPGVYPPRVYRPQLYPPGATIGPGGLQLRMPKLQAPHVQGPQMKQVQLKPPQQLKLPGRGGGSSAPAAPLLPTQGIFRQKGWIPWWVVPLLIAIVALLLLYKLSPQKVVVPDVQGQPSAFAAEQKLVEAGLKLDSNVQKQPSAALAGSVLKQVPHAGTKVNKGESVSLLVAVGTKTVSVPNIVGLTASEAEKALRAKDLALGQATPQPIDPAGKISSQIPAANQVVKQGTPVMIFYRVSRPRPTATNTVNPTPQAIAVPALGETTVAALAHRLAPAGVLPRERRVISTAPVGRAIATIPAAGATIRPGATLTILVSAGFPEIAYADGRSVQLIDGTTGRSEGAIADTPPFTKDPTWAPDGHRVAYVVSQTPDGPGQVYVKDRDAPRRGPRPVTSLGADYENLAWSPRHHVLAMDVVNGADTDLCLLKLTSENTTPQCKPETGFVISLAIHWTPDGRSILATARTRTGTSPGIVRWHTDTPFTADPAEWSDGTFVTDTTIPANGVVDAAPSPNGKWLAVVTNRDSDAYQLWITRAGDYRLERATSTGLRACKVAWRSDSREVATTQADAACAEGQGPLTRLDPFHPNGITPLGGEANDPSYQPVNIGG